jgi:hypothetical protein
MSRFMSGNVTFWGSFCDEVRDNGSDGTQIFARIVNFQSIVELMK